MEDLPSGIAAHVTAAGPSLERQMAQLASPARGGLLVATDTSLPALSSAGDECRTRSLTARTTPITTSFRACPTV